MAEELTDEQLAEFRDVASTFSPGMREIYAPPAAPVVEPPPVPLPMGRPDPSRFRMQSVPPRVDPLEGIRKQINSAQFKTAQEALSAATRFQYLRAFQRDIDSGVAPEKALLRWGPGLFEKQPAAISGMMRATQPAFTPRPLPGATNIYQVGPRGERLWSPPASSLPRPPLSTNVTEYFEPGTTNRVALGFDTGPQSRRVIETRRPGLTEAQLATFLPRVITEADKELKKIGTTVEAFEDPAIENEAERKKAAKSLFDAGQARRKELQDNLKEWRAQRDAMAKPGSTAAPAVPAPSAPAAATPVAPGPTNSIAAILKEANEALKKRPDKRAEILKRLKEMGIEVK